MLTSWLAQHWLDLLQSVGIVGSLGLTAYLAWKDERARQIGNSIAISSQHRELWKSVYGRSNVERVLEAQPDLAASPITHSERLFVTTLLGHLSTVFRAMKHGEFVQLEGLRKDVQQFFALPIPKAMWKKLKPYQDHQFVEFIESCLAPE
jgi:hypothetical protein